MFCPKGRLRNYIPHCVPPGKCRRGEWMSGWRLSRASLAPWRSDSVRAHIAVISLSSRATMDGPQESKVVRLEAQLLSDIVSLCAITKIWKKVDLRKESNLMCLDRKLTAYLFVSCASLCAYVNVLVTLRIDRLPHLLFPFLRAGEWNMQYTRLRSAPFLSPVETTQL